MKRRLGLQKRWAGLAGTLVAAAHKFDERGVNLIVPASAVGIACLADPPTAGVRVLEAAGVEVNRV